MRKPSDLKMYVNNKIKELSEEYIRLVSEDIDFNDYQAQGERNDKLSILRAQLTILFAVQKLCEERKRY